MKAEEQFPIMDVARLVKWLRNTAIFADEANHPQMQAADMIEALHGLYCKYDRAMFPTATSETRAHTLRQWINEIKSKRVETRV